MAKTNTSPCDQIASIAVAAWTMRASRIRIMSVNHYENFPVASLLCPARLRPAVTAIYWFARTADDLADEGDATPVMRLADLAAYRADLLAITHDNPPSKRWRGVFEPLAQCLKDFSLPVPLLLDLLSAFEQDVVKHRYADRTDLLDYCRRSANPVGRLLLHLYGVHDTLSLSQSDAICTALQLANFWQDVSVDVSRGRLYVPLADCARHGVCVDAVMAGTDSATLRAALRDAVAWTRALMEDGAPLVQTLRRQAGWQVGAELRLVVQGGLRILEKIEHMDFATLEQRPRLRATDVLVMLWRATWMRPAQRTPLGRAA